LTKLKHTVQRTKGGICLWSFLPCEPGNKKERCTLCSVALAKGEMRYPRPECRTSDRHSKLPPALPCSHCQPISSTTSPPGYQQREKASARGASRTRAEKQPPPPPPHPLARTASPSPSRDPQSRRRLLVGATPHCGAGLRADSAASSSPPAAVAVSPATRFELCCRGGGRPSRGQGARIARVSYLSLSTIMSPPYADFGVLFFLALSFCLMLVCTPRSGSGEFGSFRSVCL